MRLSVFSSEEIENKILHCLNKNAASFETAFLCFIKPILLVFACRFFIKKMVSVVKHEVRSNHYKIENVEEKHVPLACEVCHISVIYEL